jgi:hypothetical protein
MNAQNGIMDHPVAKKLIRDLSHEGFASSFHSDNDYVTLIIRRKD